MSSKNVKLKILIIIVLFFLCFLSVTWLLLYGRQCRHTVLRSDTALLTHIIKSVYRLDADITDIAKDSISDWITLDHIYSHRGSAGSNEHSFEAYDAAILAGSHNIEQDVVISKNGTLYVSHDLSASRMTGINKNYSDMTDVDIDNLRTVTDGKILKLSNVFERYNKDVRYIIELKAGDIGVIDAFRDIVTEHNQTDNVVVQSFNANVLQELENVFPNMPKILLCKTSGAFEDALSKEYVDEISVNNSLMTQDNLDRAHMVNKKFSVWTLDDENDIVSAIDLGVDAYFTNDTPLAVELERKLRRFKFKNHTTILTASDYQEEAGFDQPSNTLASLIKVILADGKDPDMAIFCGDYTNDSILYDHQLSPEESISEIRNVVQKDLPAVRNANIVFVQGNHDRLTESISRSGLHEYDDFLVYVMNTQNDFPWKQGNIPDSYETVIASAERMKACFDELVKSGDSRPVIIAAHLPLHFTARTTSRYITGDNMYAQYVFDVVNEAAESLDIIYIYGHNHAKGWDCYMGGSSVYKAAGDIVLVPIANKANGRNTEDYKEVSLNFTYMNAGYIGYYMNCDNLDYNTDLDPKYHAADEALTCGLIDIYKDHIEISRYDSSGKHVLGAAGESNPYNDYIDKDLIDEKYYSKEVGGTVTIVRKRAEGVQHTPSTLEEPDAESNFELDEAA